VGKTHPAGRFGDIPKALPKAVGLASSLQLQVLGVYHTLSDDDNLTFPLSSVHELFRNRLVIIKPTWGGENIFQEIVYWQGSKLSAQEVKKIHPGIDPRRNHRRIISSWIRNWGSISYSNENTLE